MTEHSLCTLQNQVMHIVIERSGIFWLPRVYNELASQVDYSAEACPCMLLLSLLCHALITGVCTYPFQEIKFGMGIWIRKKMAFLQFLEGCEHLFSAVTLFELSSTS